jgi:hypothetical protein
MTRVNFEVDKLAIAYVMQLRGIKDFGINRSMWYRIFKDIYSQSELAIIRKIQSKLRKESDKAEQLKKSIEKKWRLHERKVLDWLREITHVDFKAPIIRICVVPFGACQTPFKDIPLIIVGRIRKGWDYPESLAHELTHILFNQNFDFESEVEHPYIQLIEEEIAVRIGSRPKYFSYKIPDFADWAKKARQKEKAWKHYLQHISDFKDIFPIYRTR